MKLTVSYDPTHDTLDLWQEGVMAEMVEVYPCFSLNLDSDGALIGLEILRARETVGPAVEPLRRPGGVNGLPLKGSLADLEAQLRPTDGTEYLDYMEAWPELLESDPEAIKTLETLRRGIGAILKQVKEGTAIG